jgi:hypothetical protein
LKRDFESCLLDFQTTSKLSAQKSREYMIKAQTYLDYHTEEEEETEQAPLLKHSVLVPEEHVAYNESIIQEREQDILEIERNIVQVNEIFRDLGTIVNEQQYLLDNIETNVGNTVVNMENATHELRTANKYQKMATKRLCCLLIAGAIVITIIILFVVL